jgi:hypothetical protein
MPWHYPAQTKIIMGLLKKSKSINRRGRQGFAQRSQKAELHSFNFADFAISLCALRLKKTFSTAPNPLKQSVCNLNLYLTKSF